MAGTSPQLAFSRASCLAIANLAVLARRRFQGHHLKLGTLVDCSVAATDEQTSENLKWLRYDVQLGDEISIKLVETETAA